MKIVRFAIDHPVTVRMVCGAAVRLSGGLQEEIHVDVDGPRLASLGHGIGAVGAALADQNVNLSGGRLRDGESEYLVRALNEFTDLDDLRHTVLAERDGRVVRVGDVARVTRGHREREVVTSIGGNESVEVAVYKEGDANTVSVARRVRRRLDWIRQHQLPAGVDVRLLFDQSTYIAASVSQVLSNAIAGGVMAIVVLESIHRHQVRGEEPAVAARVGTDEVGRAVIASTLTSICVFAPVVIGQQNEILVWLSEVGITISSTLIFSLLISLTVVPLMAARMVRRGRERESRLIERAAGLYERLLGFTAIRHPWSTTAVCIPAVAVLTAVAIRASGFGLDPFSDRGRRRQGVDIDYTFTDNMNYRAVSEVVLQVDRTVRELEDELGIETVYSYYRDNDAGTDVLFRDPPLAAGRLRRIRERLRAQLPEIVGVKLRLGGDEEAGPGAKRLAVSLYGEDTEELERLAGEVKRRFELLGLTFRGAPLPSFKTPSREVDVNLVLEPGDRRTIQNLRSLTVDVEAGRQVTLGQIAGLAIGSGPQSIRRQDQRTTVTVAGSYEGEAFGKVKEQVREIMQGLSMPAGYGWSFGSRIRAADTQQRQMLLNILLALCCVYFVMASLFESFLHPLVIMLTIPFAIVGVVWTMILTRTPMNIMAMIGVVILCGIVVNNGIVLIDHVNGCRRRGLARAAAIRAGGRERFRPILMTAATTVLGLIPLAVGSSALGDAQYYPMARAVMGGLVTSTVLTLVLLPTLYVVAEKLTDRLGRWARELGRRLGRLGEGCGRRAARLVRRPVR